MSDNVPCTFEYDAETGIVTVTTVHSHHLWVNARVKLEFANRQPDFDGLREITAVGETTFAYQVALHLPHTPPGSGNYRVVNGVDYLVIEHNVINLLDVDEGEFALKEYPLKAARQQTYRAFGIIVADNGLSSLQGPHVHRQVFIHRNNIHYGLGQPLVISGLGKLTGAGMQLAGIKQLHVTHNIVDTEVRGSLRVLRCGYVRSFNNKTPQAELVQAWRADTGGCYEEPESLAEDALVLQLLGRKG